MLIMLLYKTLGINVIIIVINFTEDIINRKNVVKLNRCLGININNYFKNNIHLLTRENKI